MSANKKELAYFAIGLGVGLSLSIFLGFQLGLWFWLHQMFIVSVKTTTSVLPLVVTPLLYLAAMAALIRYVKRR